MGIPVLHMHGTKCNFSSRGMHDAEQHASGFTNLTKTASKCSFMALRRGHALWCRVCDPNVGTGLTEGLCPELCDSWHSACKEDFFQYTSHGDFTPCLQDEQTTICATMSEFAADGFHLCRRLGLESREGQQCFDGSATTAPTCRRMPLNPRQRVRKVISFGLVMPWLN